MKSEIFVTAIQNRFPVKFLYRLNEVELEPYFITCNEFGKKVIYGRVNKTNEIKFFEYDAIANIKTLNNIKFSPIIPILPYYN